MRRGALVVVLLAVVACQTGAPPERAVPGRVVVLALDGVGADLAERWVDAGTTPVLAEVASAGRLERLRTVDPTLTSVNFASMSTGVAPDGHGIVSGWFRPAGEAITATASGFAAPLEATPIWVRAREAGVSVVSVLWPGADAKTLARMADAGVAWPRPPLVRGEVVELDPESAGSTGEIPSQDGLAPLLWRVPVEGVELALEVVLVDGSPDGRARYDTVTVRRDGAADWTWLGERDWFEVTVELEAEHDMRPHRYASWGKVLYLDRRLGRMRLYRGPVNRLFAYPDDVARRLEEAVGPWPGEPDADLLSDWWLLAAEGIDLDTYLEQLERLDRWIREASRLLVAEHDPRLLLAYHPAADEYQHASLIVDPEQWAYSPGRALAASEGLARVGRNLDRTVAAAREGLDPAMDTLLVVSDHGLAPLHDLVRVNVVLAEVGLVRTDDGTLAADTPMRAVGSGGCAHLYLNLVGREPTGVVAPEEADEALRRAARALADLSVEGEPVVERVVTRAEAAAIGLDHPASGDLIAFLRPGYAAVDDLAGAPIAPSPYYGQHGYLAEHDSMDGMWVEWGAGASRRRGEVATTDVAPTLAAWLGL